MRSDFICGGEVTTMVECSKETIFQVLKEEGGKERRSCTVGATRCRHSYKAVECRKVKAPSTFLAGFEEEELRSHHDGCVGSKGGVSTITTLARCREAVFHVIPCI